jgi:hypothetical protein
VIVLCCTNVIVLCWSEMVLQPYSCGKTIVQVGEINVVECAKCIGIVNGICCAVYTEVGTFNDTHGFKSLYTFIFYMLCISLVG